MEPDLITHSTQLQVLKHLVACDVMPIQWVYGADTTRILRELEENHGDVYAKLVEYHETAARIIDTIFKKTGVVSAETPILQLGAAGIKNLVPV